MSNFKQIEDFYTSKRDRKRRAFFSGIKKAVLDKIKKALPTKKQISFLPKVLSNKERKIFIALILIFAISLAYLPLAFYYKNTEAISRYGGSYKEGIIGEPRHINPLLSQANDADRDLVAVIFDGLLKYDQKGSLVPNLVESYEISENGLVYTFKLREDIKWHDGENLSADDVVFTILLAQNPDYNSPQRINWQGVEVRKVDQYTVQFRLQNKYAQFLTNTTMGIIPKHLWADVRPTNFALSELNLKPTGSGPYKFSKFKKDQLGRIKEYELHAHEDYVHGRPYISKITFLFYASEDEMIQAHNRNEVSGLSFISPKKMNEIKFRQRLNIQNIAIPRYFAVFFNQNKSIALSDKNVRLALNYGTNRKELVDEILNGMGAEVYSPILPDLLNVGEPLQKYKYDPEFAQMVLDNGQWEKGQVDGRTVRSKNNQELEIKITTSNWPELARAAELLKNQWEKLGAKIELEILPISELQQIIREREYEALLFGEVLNIDLDPLSFWHSSQRRDPGLNLALYGNETVDKFLEEARQTINPIERASKYDDFQKALLEDVPVVFLYSPYYLYAPNKKIKDNNIKIISVPSSRFSNINEWYIKTKRTWKR